MMSTRGRALLIGATLAATQLAGMTAAHRRGRRPPQRPHPAPPGEPAGRPGWLLPSLGVLAVVVAVAGVLIAGPRMAGGRHETVP
jgi:hypothetical protein